MNINDLFILRWISASMLALGWLRYRMTSFSSRSSAVQTSHADGAQKWGICRTSSIREVVMQMKHTIGKEKTPQ